MGEVSFYQSIDSPPLSKERGDQVREEGWERAGGKEGEVQAREQDGGG
jgi:hypothetical protein